jgi:hypothetical protein
MGMGEGTGLAASTALSPRTRPPLNGSFHLLVLCIATCATKLPSQRPNQPGVQRLGSRYCFLPPHSDHSRPFNIWLT